jgi:UDP-N-acetylmuramoyl-tripeptide--D-alanyl-D-alanine ligase
LNDDYGTPLTLLGHKQWPLIRQAGIAAPFVATRFIAGVDEYPKVLVLEFATHWDGHLERLAKLAPPDIAIVTTIAPAHLERLLTMEGIVREKSAIVRAASPSGLVILGEDHDYVAELERVAPARVIKLRGRGLGLSRAITFAVCRHLNVPDHVVDLALADFRPPSGRLTRLDLPGMTMLNDTVNANPASMELALDTLSEIATGRRVAILGHMAELGSDAARYHQAVGRYARNRSDIVIGVGELAKNYQPDHWFETSDACAERITQLIQSGDCILVKGSASAKMGHVAAKLRDSASSGARG